METGPSRVTGFCFIGSSVWSGSGREAEGHEEVYEKMSRHVTWVDGWKTEELLVKLEQQPAEGSSRPVSDLIEQLRTISF